MPRMAAQTKRKRARTGWAGVWAVCLCATVIAAAALVGSLRALGQPPPLGARAQLPATAPAAAPATGSLLFTQAACAPVYAAASATAPLITQLLGGADVT